MKRFMIHILLVTVLAAIFPLTTEARTPAKKASKVLLVWESMENVVSYEVEISDIRYQNKEQRVPNGHVIYRQDHIFAPGVEISTANLNGHAVGKLYYRVRALDIDQNPISLFTKSERLDQGFKDYPKPFATSYFNNSRLVPLYPTYSWIPVLNAARYEVEITNQQPENPNGTHSSIYRITSQLVEGSSKFDSYDFTAYTAPGTYYWRVLAFDDHNNPIGSYSDAIPFTVHDGTQTFAALGDSITHGGGAISNPPADKRYDYTYYVPYPVKNLGRSGDTSEAVVDRFDHDVLPFRPTYLFILAGSNSIRGGTPAAEVIANFEQLKEKCSLNGITPVFLTLPPLNPARIERVFNQPTAGNWQEELAKTNSYLLQQKYVIDVYSQLVDKNGRLPENYSTDGLHPDIKGKKIIGNAVAAFIKEFIRK